MTTANKKRKKFSMRHFRTLVSEADILDYANSCLPLLGKGSSRVVYACSKSKVLKISINDKGYVQNSAELGVAHNKETEGAVSAILDFKTDGEGNILWLVSQLVRTVTDADEFKSLAGFSWEVYGDTVRAFAKSNAQNDLETITSSISDQYSKRLVRLKNEGDERNARYYETLLGDLEIMKNSIFFRGIISAMSVNRLMPGDILEIDHYGKTSNGDIVLYDYGFTEDIAKRFYSTAKKNSLNEVDNVYQIPLDGMGDEAAPKTFSLRKKAG